MLDIITACWRRRDREEVSAWDGSIVKDNKRDDDDDHGTDGRGVQRKVTRKKDGLSCGGRSQSQRDRRL